MNLPSGWIARPKVDRKGIEVTMEMSELILCKDCEHYKYGVCYQHSGFRPNDDWFCADAELKGEQE